ncbi:hypothetical protein [Novipirellula artificiosorum]|uniref:Uncharacterized protein n=1 Tax=Novipirellula artificiosorum TaxID=2528016 RepID=A0A5C6DSQ5_9BACT|nr:hypothetical protein [Novipirellula artificiosorum]TWU39234.1 hypothetical protein Poly41_20560 [Novipirellula artificiosorum]
MKRHCCAPKIIDLPRSVWIALLAIAVLLIHYLGAPPAVSGQSLERQSSWSTMSAWEHTLQSDPVPARCLDCDGGGDVAFSTLQFDGVTEFFTSIDSATAGATVQSTELNPQSVYLSAALANFDSDAQPDGWMVELTLIDRQDRAVIVPATARIEMHPRPTLTDHAGATRTEATEKVIQWTVRFVADEDGVARVKLPLRRSQQRSLGWFVSDSPYARGDLSRPKWQRQLAYPKDGQLSASVSTGSGKTFKATTMVQIRPSFLVDTPWPYR